MDEALDNLGDMASSTLNEVFKGVNQAQKMAQDKAAEAAADQVKKSMGSDPAKMD
jgi:hypothetical protein